MDDLPPMAANLVRQWPAGAYEAVCQTFRLHWLSETRAIGRKSDWSAALGKWLINDHPQIMRAAKAGVSFAQAAPARPAEPSRRMAPVAAKAHEDARSAKLHAALKCELGHVLYGSWIGPAAFVFDPPGLVCTFPTEFARGWGEDRFGPKIRAIAESVSGGPVQWVRFQAETPSNHHRQQERPPHHG